MLGPSLRMQKKIRVPPWAFKAVHDRPSSEMPFKLRFAGRLMQSELPRPIPRNSVESDHGCTSRIYFDNAGDNVTLTLYNVTLMSQKPWLYNNRCDCSKRNGLHVYPYSTQTTNRHELFFFNSGEFVRFH